MQIKYVITTVAAGLLLLWTACTQKENQPDTIPPLSQQEQETYTHKGKEIAAATFATLSGRLQQAMKEGGVPNAVDYCKLMAYPLVDSLSKVHKATIRRAAIKVRNPQNAADSYEKDALDLYASQVERSATLSPTVKLIDSHTVAFYAPIMIQPLCLNCHGTVNEELSPENYGVIQSKYPADQATGYKAGDLRGIWSIRFERK